MKLCLKCREEKEEKEFNRNKDKKDGLQNWCKICTRENSTKYYRENTESYRAKIEERKLRIRTENRGLILEYLKTHPCVDCGFKRPSALDFDHVRGEKKKNVSQMVTDGNTRWDDILLEIEKCEVRCANCHRIKTARQFNWYSAD